MDKAQFRATRDMLGLTQQQVADAFGVNRLTVKRWERPDVPYTAPDSVVEWIAELSRVQDATVEQAVAAAVATVPPRGRVQLTYYRTQDEYDEWGRDEGPYETANANARLAAARLRSLGYRVDFAYPADQDNMCHNG